MTSRSFIGCRIFDVQVLLILMVTSPLSAADISVIDLSPRQPNVLEFAAPTARGESIALFLSRTLAAAPWINDVRKPLGALDVVQTTVTNNLTMRSAVTNLNIQAQRQARVTRAEFSPKLSSGVSAQRDISVGSETTQSNANTQAVLDLSWRLRTGANIRLGNTLTRNAQSAQSVQQTQSSQGVSLSISQPLLKGAGRVVNEAGLVGAESAFRVAVKALERTAQTLVAQVLGAYIAVQQAQDASRQAQVAYELAQRLHELNLALVGAGRSPRNVLLQSESDIAAARLGIAQAQNTQRLAIRALAQAMGRSNQLDGSDLLLADTFAAKVDSPMPDEQTLVTQAAQASSELFAAREAVALAELALNVASDNLLPSLALTAGSTVSSGNTLGARNRNNSVGLNFEYSFDRAPVKLEKAAALANLDTARSQLQETEQRVRDAASDALRSHSFARAQYDLANNALALATQRLDAEVTRQSLGRTSQLELTTAQQSLAASNRQLLDAARLVFRSQIELAQIDGSLLQKWGVQSLLDGWIAQAQQELNQ